MTSFLLSISFIVHFILLIAIYYLFKQITELKQNHSDKISKVFEKYLNDIKQENIRLQSEIELSNVHDQMKQVSDQVAYEDPPSADLQQQMPLKEKDKTPLEIDTGSTKDTLETSLQAKILQLHNQGLNIDEIAKKLNCGKTEVELMINLYRQKKS